MWVFSHAQIIVPLFILVSLLIIYMIWGGPVLVVQWWALWGLSVWTSSSRVPVVPSWYSSFLLPSKALYLGVRLTGGSKCVCVVVYLCVSAL